MPAITICNKIFYQQQHIASFQIKVGKYSERCEAEGIVFISLVLKTFGGWRKDSLEVVTKLGRQVSRQTGKEEDEIVNCKAAAAKSGNSVGER